MVKRRGRRFRRPGRARRVTDRLLTLITVPHPPVKHVSAHKMWKNVSMTRRLEHAKFRRLALEAERRAQRWQDDYLRAHADVEVTTL